MNLPQPPKEVFLSVPTFHHMIFVDDSTITCNSCYEVIEEEGYRIELEEHEFFCCDFCRYHGADTDAIQQAKYLDLAEELEPLGYSKA
jgi:hypothetical protein